MKQGGPLKRYKALETKTPMRRGGWTKRKPPTEKQRDDRAWLDESKRIIWKRSGGRCEFSLYGTLGVSLDPWGHGSCREEVHNPHHISRQSQGHDHRPENLLAVCRCHHRWIHDNVSEARALGYLSPAKRGDL